MVVFQYSYWSEAVHISQLTSRSCYHKDVNVGELVHKCFRCIIIVRKNKKNMIMYVCINMLINCFQDAAADQEQNFHNIPLAVEQEY